jgi:hypothetical protein
VRAQGRVDPLEAGDDVADPGRHRLAGALALVAEPPGAPAEPRGRGQLVQQRVALVPRQGGPLGVGPALGLVDLLLQVGEPGAELPAGPLVQDLVGAQAQARQAGLPAARGGHQLGRVDRLAGRGEQRGEVAQPLGVPHANRLPGELERPLGAVPAEGPARRRRGLPVLAGPCLARQLVHAEEVGLGADPVQRRGGLRAPGGVAQQQAGQLVAAAQGPGAGAEPLVGGQRPLEVGQRPRRAPQRGLQPSEMVGDRAVEGDGRPDDDRAAVVGASASRTRWHSARSPRPAASSPIQASATVQLRSMGSAEGSRSGSSLTIASARSRRPASSAAMAAQQMVTGESAGSLEPRVSISSRRRPWALRRSQSCANSTCRTSGSPICPPRATASATSRSTSPKRPVMSARMARRASAA